MIESAVGYLGVFGVAAVASGVSFVVGAAIVPLARKVCELAKRFFSYVTAPREGTGFFAWFRPIGCKDCIDAHAHNHPNAPINFQEQPT